MVGGPEQQRCSLFSRIHVHAECPQTCPEAIQGIVGRRHVQAPLVPLKAVSDVAGGNRQLFLGSVVDGANMLALLKGLSCELLHRVPFYGLA